MSNLKKNRFHLIFDNNLYNLSDDILSVNYPGLSISTVASYHKGQASKQAGDNVTYDSLSITIRVDEKMENYDKFYEWIVSMVHGNTGHKKHKGINASLVLYDLNEKIFKKVKFVNIFPTQVGAIEFRTNTDDNEWQEADITFEYDYYENEYMYGG